MRDWSAFNKDLNAATRTDEESYDTLIRCPSIPQAVRTLLCNPPGGKPQASLSNRGFTLNNMAAQHREEALKAMDRATRTTFKYQALVQWAADAIQQMTEQTPAAEKRNPYAYDPTLGRLLRGEVNALLQKKAIRHLTALLPDAITLLSPLSGSESFVDESNSIGQSLVSLPRIPGQYGGHSPLVPSPHETTTVAPIDLLSPQLTRSNDLGSAGSIDHSRHTMVDTTIKHITGPKIFPREKRRSR